MLRTTSAGRNFDVKEKTSAKCRGAFHCRCIQKGFLVLMAFGQKVIFFNRPIFVSHPKVIPVY